VLDNARRGRHRPHAGGAGGALVTKDIVRNGDAISGAVLAALGAYVFLESRNWAYFTDDGPGPGFFPAWYGAAMIALSLALIVSAVRKAREPDSYDWPGIGRALATWAAFAISAVLMGWLGFLVSFMLLAFFMVVVVFRQPPLSAAIIAVSGAIGFYLVFPLALGVPLPTGIFGI
jgi:putative tricarboxylic transport membrane protein